MGYGTAKDPEPYAGEEGRCNCCGQRMRTSSTGRPPKFCGAACRQRAYRRRNSKTKHAERGKRIGAPAQEERALHR